LNASEVKWKMVKWFDYRTHRTDASDVSDSADHQQLYTCIVSGIGDQTQTAVPIDRDGG